METACQRHRDGRKLLVEGFGTEVGGRGEFADVERQVAHHPAVGRNLRLHVDLLELQSVHGDSTAEQWQ